MRDSILSTKTSSCRFSLAKGKKKTNQIITYYVVKIKNGVVHKTQARIFIFFRKETYLVSSILIRYTNGRNCLVQNFMGNSYWGNDISWSKGFLPIEDGNHYLSLKKLPSWLKHSCVWQEHTLIFCITFFTVFQQIYNFKAFV